MITLNGVEKSHGGRMFFSGVSLQLNRGDRLGLVGPNGAGKTTLFRLITGQEEADAGEIHIGETVQLAYVDQSRETLTAENTVWQEISGGDENIELGERTMNSRAYVSRFNFGGSDQQQAVGTLSGVQRHRVHLAKVLR